MDVRISTETGKPMLLGLGTAERNSGLVMQPCMFVSQMPVSALLVICPNPQQPMGEKWITRKP